MVPITYYHSVTLNKKSDIVYFDFAKAFDSVSHPITLYHTT